MRGVGRMELLHRRSTGSVQHSMYKEGYRLAKGRVLTKK